MWKYLLMLLLVACGPVTQQKTHFTVVVHNVTTLPETMTLNWAIGGQYVGTSTRSVDAMSTITFVLGEAGPDLVELKTVAWTTAWGPPDWQGQFVFHIVYPTMQTYGAGF